MLKALRKSVVRRYYRTRNSIRNGNMAHFNKQSRWSICHNCRIASLANPKLPNLRIHEISVKKNMLWRDSRKNGFWLPAIPLQLSKIFAQIARSNLRFTLEKLIDSLQPLL
ncbi:hypothetical protein Ocin01_20145 [Orchesella cincta]|uniref:Uncharacterized protein n=1 Tax=Orchesella cincta TaxID=48709 RepID=A0A1D2M0P4_ORCCI|nr:hypothetical protein Ocin01_20145 [Orchesella cincta]